MLAMTALPPPTLHGTATVLRPIAQHDAEALAKILAEPEVAAWWPAYDAERVRRELIEAHGPVVFVIEADGEVIGSIQYFEEPSPDYRHASIDIFIATAHHGRGLGADAIRTMARYLVHDRGHHRLAIDPAVTNVRAIRSYQRVGFHPVGVMRRYERNADGEWQDCLLMDALAQDLH